MPRVQQRHLARLLPAVAVTVGVLPAGDELARDQASDREPPDVVVVVEVVDLELGRRVGVARRSREALDDRVEQHLERRPRIAGGAQRDTGARIRVHDREVELRVVGAKIDEEGVHLVQHLGDTGIGTVDLVDAKHSRETELQRLFQDEPRLRQRPFGRIDDEENAVDHGERALDLAAEVGMPRRVDDVDLHAAVRDRSVLRENRDTALALEVIRVHDPLDHDLVGAEDPALVQHRIDERRLSVVDVRDDRDVPHVGAYAGAARHGACRAALRHQVTISATIEPVKRDVARGGTLVASAAAGTLAGRRAV